MTHDEMIAVIQHHKDGGEVEVFKGKSWTKVSGIPTWDFRTYMYRPYIEPKPKQVVLIEKWLLKMQGTEQYAIEEGSKEEMNTWGKYKTDAWQKVKLLETYEVEI